MGKSEWVDFNFNFSSNRFGSKIHSNRTGIILNDSMDDFSIPGRNNGFGLPPSPANFIRPYHRPLSSMCPTILLDEHGKVELLIGAAGGSRITSSVAYVSKNEFYFIFPTDKRTLYIYFCLQSGADEVFILQ